MNLFDNINLTRVNLKCTINVIQLDTEEIVAGGDRLSIIPRAVPGEYSLRTQQTAVTNGFDLSAGNIPNRKGGQ